jgi:hypothetical protein
MGPSLAIIHSHNARRDPTNAIVLHEVKVGLQKTATAFDTVRLR